MKTLKYVVLAGALVISCSSFADEYGTNRQGGFFTGAFNSLHQNQLRENKLKNSEAFRRWSDSQAKVNEAMARMLDQQTKMMEQQQKSMGR